MEDFRAEELKNPKATPALIQALLRPKEENYVLEYAGKTLVNFSLDRLNNVVRWNISKEKVFEEREADAEKISAAVRGAMHPESPIRHTPAKLGLVLHAIANDKALQKKIIEQPEETEKGILNLKEIVKLSPKEIVKRLGIKAPVSKQ